MDNLTNAGLNLRTVSFSDITQLVGDLNYNFQQLLNLPGFKGTSTIINTTTPSTVGERGSVWIITGNTQFIDNYVSITSGSQVTLSFINYEYGNDLPNLLTVLGVDKIVNNDIIILPSKNVIQFNSTTSLFETTDISFAENTQITEEVIRQIVLDLLGTSGVESVMSLFDGVGKNFSDTSGGLNTSTNSNSILDIPVPNAGVGVPLSEFQFISTKPLLSPTGKQIMQIVGSSYDYHRLVQDTMINLTNDYIPGIDDFASLAVLQNSNANGILIGHKDATTLKDFSKIYNTSNGLRITSHNSPVSTDYSEINFNDIKIYVRSKNEIELETALLRINGDVTHSLLNLSIDAILGSLKSLTTIKGDSIYLNTNDIDTKVQFLGLDSSKKLIKSEYNVPTGTTLTNETTKIVNHNTLSVLNTEIDERFNEIESSLSGSPVESAFFRTMSQVPTTGGNMNALIEAGSWYIPKPAINYSHYNIPYSDLNNQEKTNVDCAFLRVYASTLIENDITTTKYLQVFTSKSSVVDTNGNNPTLTWHRFVKRIDDGLTMTITFENWTTVNRFANLSIGGGLIISTSTEGKEFLEHDVIYTPEEISALTDPPSTEEDEDTQMVTKVYYDVYGHITKVDYEDFSTYTQDQINLLIERSSPTGSIIMWSGVTIPNGWALCSGQKFSLSTGESFACPDLTRRFIVGAEFENEVSSPGLENGYGIGQTDGQDLITLNYNQVPTGSFLNSDVVGQSMKYINPYGKADAHENRPPWFALAYIIKLPSELSGGGYLPTSVAGNGGVA